MAEKTENALNESRILVLVAQVLLGFQYQAIFQPGFDKLPRSAQNLKLSGLALLLLALCLLMAPAAYHRIVERGHLTRRLNAFITKMTTPALLPFAIGLGFDFYVSGLRVLGPNFGLWFGVVAFLIAAFFWYGIEFAAACRDAKPSKERDSMREEPTPLAERIKFVLTEARVVLPGAQALLGFQFAAVLTEGFEKLPASLTYVHLASLASVAFATILLMAPAAFHRIAERGEDTERLHTFASSMILGAMGFLALGMSGDVVIVVQKVTHSFAWAIGSATVTLCLFYGVWFGYMFCRRAADPQPARQPTPLPAP